MKKFGLLLSLVLAVFVFTGCSRPLIRIKGNSADLSQEEIKTKVENFINENLVQPGTKVEITEVAFESGLYKLTVKIGETQIIESYATKDGKVFFPDAINIAEIEKQAAATRDQQAAQANIPKEAPKTNVPEVELFVMSYCPYGTQVEKGILPVVKTLGSKIKYSLKFVDYAMHGNQEIDENLRQYCIQKNQPAKLSAYMTCFLKKGAGTEEACMKTAGVNATQVAGCVTETDAQFSIKKDAADKSKWSNGQFPPFNVDKADNDKYGVAGSPTLVVNGVEVSSARDSASLLKTICSAFTTEPKECQAKLSSDTPAPGFGEGTAAAGSSANADCVVPQQ